MNRRTPEQARAIAESLGPAERLVQLIINFPDHLWHNRPGVIRNGKWNAATRQEVQAFKANGRLASGEFRPAGPNPEAIEQVYGALADIWQANNELAARLASYIMKETDWRDMKRSEEHTSELHSSPTRRSSDLQRQVERCHPPGSAGVQGQRSPRER